MDEFAAKDERFVVVHKENEGLSAGWNQGMRLATGKWIAFVDTDDWIEPDYIEKLVEAAEKNDADVTLGSGYYICTESKKIEAICPAKFHTVFTNGKGAEKLQTRCFTIEKGSNYSVVFAWNKIYKRNFLIQEDIKFDTHLPAGAPNDVVFNFEVYGAAKTVCIADVIGYNYRFMQTSATRRFRQKDPEIRHLFLDDLYQYLEENKDVTASMMQLLDSVSLKNFVSSFRVCFFHPDNTADRKTVARELAKMKEMPRFKHAIWQGKNPYLNKKQVILKYALRLPFVFPMEMLYKANKKVQKSF